MGPKAEELIREYGDQAYHMAVQLTMSATLIGDVEGAEIFSAAARELLQAGYHKFERKSDGE